MQDIFMKNLEDQSGNEYYQSEDGKFLMERACPDTFTENGNDISGYWIVYESGEMRDWNRYRHDLAGKYNFQLGF